MKSETHAKKQFNNFKNRVARIIAHNFGSEIAFFVWNFLELRSSLHEGEINIFLWFCVENGDFLGEAQETICSYSSPSPRKVQSAETRFCEFLNTTWGPTKNSKVFLKGSPPFFSPKANLLASMTFKNFRRNKTEHNIFGYIAHCSIVHSRPWVLILSCTWNTSTSKSIVQNHDRR